MLHKIAIRQLDTAAVQSVDQYIRGSLRQKKTKTKDQQLGIQFASYKI